MKPADLIITNAKVYTVDEENPTAEAVAVRGDEIVYVGDEAGVEAWRGPRTRLIDGQGHTLLPGFIDSHFHLLFGAIGLGDAQLHEVASLEDLRAIFAAYAADNSDLEWLRGQGLRYDILPDGEPLTRHHLDAIESKRPLIIMGFDYHTLWANTAALERAGLLRGTDDLPGSAEIVMGPDGLATGELREEAAYSRLLNLVPEPDDNRKRALLQNGLAYLASLGVTSVHNMNGDVAEAALYAALEDLGELSLRVYVPYSVRPETSVEDIAREAVPMRDQFQGELVRAGAVKFFMDGVYESYTALSLDAYPDQPDNYGEPIYSLDHFVRMAAEADRYGFQIAVHACGDGAVRRALDGYAAVREVNGPRDSRHRVEHIEMIHADDAPRFAQLGVIASMQPLHAPLEEDDDDLWLTRVRPSEWDRAFAWRTLRDASAVLVFGSDWPVASPDPIAGIAGAVNRQPWRPGVNPHRQTLAEAIAAYTRDAAYAEFQEARKGRIKVDMWADLALLTEDIFAVPPEEIEHVRVALTVCNGRIVYENS